jgi:Family of unknown function (DUF5996)
MSNEAYSHEVSSAGFWPGGGVIDYPAFYSYVYPMPEGFRSAPVQPGTAFFSQELGEFLLPMKRCEQPGHRIGHSCSKGQMGPQHSNARREFRVCRVQFPSARTT